MRRADRASLLLLLALGAALLGWVVFARTVAPALIERAYRGGSVAVLNRLIRGQAAHSLEEYLADWQRRSRRVELGLAIAGLLVIAVARPEVRGVLDIATDVARAHGAPTSRPGPSGIALGAALLLWTAGALIVQGDLVLRFDRGIWGADHDGAWNLWALSWGLHALTTGPRHFFDANILYPARDTFALSEMRLADLVVFAPVRILTGSPLVAYNALIVAQLVFTALGTALLAHHLFGSWRGAALAGAMFGLSPTRLAHLDQSQLLTAGWTPLALLFLDRFLDRRAWRDILACAACVALQCLASFYLGYFLVIAAAVWLSARVVADPRGVVRPAVLWRGAVGAALLASVLLPVARPYLRVRQEYGTLEMPRGFLERASAEGVVSYLAARPRSLLYGTALMPPQSGLSWEKWLFPGFLCLALAALALAAPTPSAETDGTRRTVWTLWVLVAVAFTLSLGPTLHLGGARVPSPYRLLAYGLPGFGSMRVPARLGFLVALGLALAAAAGYRWLDARLPRSLHAGGFLAVFALVVAESVVVPAHVPAMPRPNDVPEEYRWLAAEGRGAVLELPIWGWGKERGDRFEALRRETRYMYWSLYHWRPLVNGYTSYPLSTTEEVIEHVQAFPAAESVRYLEAIGVRHVLVHPEAPQYAEFSALAAPLAPGAATRRFPSGTLAVTLPEAVTAERLAVTLKAPPRWRPGAQMLPVRFANLDSHRYWVNRGQRACHLSAHWMAPDSGEISSERLSVLPPVALAPGEARERAVTVRVPDRPGPLTLERVLTCQAPPGRWASESSIIVATGGE